MPETQADLLRLGASGGAERGPCLGPLLAGGVSVCAEQLDGAPSAPDGFGGEPHAARMGGLTLCEEREPALGALKGSLGCRGVIEAGEARGGLCALSDGREGQRIDRGRFAHRPGRTSSCVTGSSMNVSLLRSFTSAKSADSVPVPLGWRV